MRREQDRIAEAGAGIVAIGTGDARYANAFVDDTRIGFPVLLDEDGAAARAASVRKGGVMQLVGPEPMRIAARAFARGHRQHRTGKRGTQLGATFVIGPGDRVRFEHLDAHVGDHAPIEAILAALRDG